MHDESPKKLIVLPFKVAHVLGARTCYKEKKNKKMKQETSAVR